MSVSLEWKGLDELQNKISYLSDSEARSVFRQGVSAGAKVVRDYAKASAPGPEIIFKTKSSADSAEAEIGPVKAKWYYKFAETGTQAHGPKRKKNKFMRWNENGKLILARRVRGVRAKPWLQPALNDHLEEVEAAIVAGYLKRLAKVSV